MGTRNTSKQKRKSNQWFNQHVNDPFVKEAERQGLRSRAAFKLQECQDKYQLIQPGDSIIDLGAAPGGWSQCIARWVGPTGNLVACDLLPMPNIGNMTFIQGDFTEEATYEAILNAVASQDGQGVKGVVSDMAPNLSGIKASDQAQMAYLNELTLDIADKLLKEKGFVYLKTFHGEAFESTRELMRKQFKRTVVFKPKASRDRSSEVFLLASNAS